MQTVFERSRSRGTARVVMLALADHADEDLVAYPSLTRLAQYANVDRRSAIRAVNRLVELGELVRIGTGRRASTIYRIVLDERPTSDADVTSANEATPQTDKACGACPSWI